MASDRRQVAAITVAALVPLIGGACYYACPRYRNTSGGMEPTLRIGDVVFVRRGASVSRGDIVAFRYALAPKIIYLKRVVGMPGETVEIRDKRLILNGKVVDEPYVTHEDSRIYPENRALPEPYRSRDQLAPVRIPDDGLFVMGDNRDWSSDSRYRGPVAKENIIGKAFLVISPLGSGIHGL